MASSAGQKEEENTYGKNRPKTRPRLSEHHKGPKDKDSILITQTKWRTIEDRWRLENQYLDTNVCTMRFAARTNAVICDNFRAQHVAQETRVLRWDGTVTLPLRTPRGDLVHLKRVCAPGGGGVS